MSTEKARIKWIDLVRAAAILSVVLCHAIEAVYQFELENVTSLSMQSRIFGFTCHTAGRLGVPLFLMITGSLLLPREYDNDRIKDFWKNKWLHLLACTLIWIAIYDAFLVLREHASISFLQLAEEMLFLRRVNMSHVWYLPTILGLYLLLPFVSMVLKKYDNKLFLFPLLIYTFYSLGVTTLNVAYRVYHPELRISNQFSFGFSGAHFGLYILYGYFISKGTFKKIRSLYVAAASIAAFVSVVFIQIWSYQKGFEYKMRYNDVLLLLASMGIYELASRVKTIYGYKIVRQISFYSFAVFLMHNIFIRTFAHTVNTLALTKPLKVLLLWIICFVASYAASVLISKIPKFGKYILYMK